MDKGAASPIALFAPSLESLTKVPAVVLPAIMVTTPDKLRALDYTQAVGHTANRSGYCGCACAGQDQHTATENGCGRNHHANLSMMASLSSIDHIFIMRTKCLVTLM